MPQPSPQETGLTPQGDVLDERARALCVLRQRLTELHAQLEYLKLMLKLGIR